MWSEQCRDTLTRLPGVLAAIWAHTGAWQRASNPHSTPCCFCTGFFLCPVLCIWGTASSGGAGHTPVFAVSSPSQQQTTCDHCRLGEAGCFPTFISSPALTCTTSEVTILLHGTQICVQNIPKQWNAYPKYILDYLDSLYIQMYGHTCHDSVQKPVSLLR